MSVTKENISASTKSWTQAARDFSISTKGKDLAMSSTIMYILVMFIVGLAIGLAAILNAGGITRNMVHGFFIVHASISIICMTVILLLGAFKMLTNDKHYLDQKSTTFVRAGVTGLGTGGMIYMAIGLVRLQCAIDWKFFCDVFGLIFVGMEMIILVKYSKVRINMCALTGFIGRFITAQVIATNAVLWITLVGTEAEEEAAHLADAHSVTDHTETPSLFPVETSSTSNSSCTITELESILMPYAYPFLIEFCVVASTMLFVVWENSGHGYYRRTSKDSREDVENANGKTNQAYDITEERKEADSSAYDSLSNSTDLSHRRDSILSSDGTNNDSDFITFDTSSGQKPEQKYMGSIFGWILLVVVLSLTIIVLFDLYADKGMFAVELSYILNAVLSGICLLVCVSGFFKLSKLTFLDEELKQTTGFVKRTVYACAIKHKMDQRLSIMCLLSLIAMKFFCAIAGYDQGCWVVFGESIVSVVFGIGQTVFIAYAENKRTKTSKQLEEKPGIRHLNFLHISNFSLWFLNTFLLKNPEVKYMMTNTYGSMEWAVLSAIFQPLSILYYFHVMVTVAETIDHIYTNQYVGIIRKSKLKKLGLTKSGSTEDFFNSLQL